MSVAGQLIWEREPKGGEEKREHLKWEEEQRRRRKSCQQERDIETGL